MHVEGSCKDFHSAISNAVAEQLPSASVKKNNWITKGTLQLIEKRDLYLTWIRAQD